MAPNTVPPRAKNTHESISKEKKHYPEYQRDGSVRAAFDHDTPTKREDKTRARLDSSGSTRGAFYHSNSNNNNKSPNDHGHRARRKKSPKKSPPPNNGLLSSNAEAMGNMASLAMEGLSSDDIGGFMDGSSPLKDINKRPQRFFSRTAVESPLSDDVEAQPKGLETIMDAEGSSENFDSGSLPSNNNNNTMAPPPSRSAYAATRTLQSEQSLDFSTALYQQPPPLAASGRESLTMQYSGASMTMDNSNQDFNFLAHVRGDIPLSMRTTESGGGLHGADIPLSARTNDFSVDSNPSLRGVMIPNNLYGGWYQQQQQQQHGAPNTATSYATSATSQQQEQEIANFSSMVQADYGGTQYAPPPASSAFLPQRPPPPDHQLSRTLHSELDDDEDDDELEDTLSYQEEDTLHVSFAQRVKHFLDPTDFLLSDTIGFDQDGNRKFDNKGWTLPSLLRHFLYNPEYPEFTSLQQFSWAVILGIVMGFYTAIWKNIIEHSVDFVWETIPGALYKWGFFTDLDGKFPLPNYMWICPAIFGGVLSYIFVILPRKIPGQNEWIAALHARGVQDHETFWPLFVLSTLGMSSGLSLGPELPLVLTAGMVGSWLGVISKQSMLQARVMNLTAASAAVGGFFGFPMAGAMFVLEIPHRMGLQYFEALSPATIASIVAVLVNRMIVNNDVTGYYNYPFLTATLPSHIFTTAIVYGLVGSGIGVVYAEGVMFLKHLVHDLFNTHHGHHHENDEEHESNDDDETEKKKRTNDDYQNSGREEMIPLVVHMNLKPHDAKFVPHRSNSIFERIGDITRKILSCGIKHEPTRAAVAGTLAGAVVGITCMFVPHVMFWGEAQLQTLIDKGRTPLPIFGEEHKSTKDLTAYGFCLINPKDASEVAAGFSIGCAALITSAKILVTGLSLGTGIIGGHFWGPLFVGCAASHLLTDLALLLQRNLGFGEGLAAYPCVSILCMMGSTHVVTFRAHMAIMLILTLTISAFDGGDSSGTGYSAGDYSAVFPLLVVSVFVSLMISRGTVFYAAQRSRGDIMALPEVLCEPGKEGAPMIIDYYESDSFTTESQQDSHDQDSATGSLSTGEEERRNIEKDFAKQQRVVTMSRSDSESSGVRDIRKTSSSSQHRIPEPDVPFLPKEEVDGPPVIPRPTNAVPAGRSLTVSVDHDEHPAIERSNVSAEDFDLPSKRLQEMLDKPVEPRFRPPRRGHRRVHSAPNGELSSLDIGLPVSTSPSRSPGHRRMGSIGGQPIRERSNSTSSSRAGTPTSGLKKISSYGEVSDFQPSLLDQARQRASSQHRRSGSSSSFNKRIPRGSGHSRQNSTASASSAAVFFSDAPPLDGSATSVTFNVPVDTDIPNEDMDDTFAQAAAGLNPSIWS